MVILQIQLSGRGPGPMRLSRTLDTCPKAVSLTESSGTDVEGSGVATATPGGGASTRLTALTAIPRWGIGPRSRKGQRDHIVHFLSESIPGLVGLDAPPAREVLGVHDEVRTRAT